jgi:hypothetical protein
VWKLFCEFPFEDEASAANYKGILLSVVLRHVLPDNFPLVIIDASTPGIGKGYLSTALSRIRHGTDHGMVPMPKDDEEMRKKITSLLKRGNPLIRFDEVTSVYHTSLAQVLTERMWEDRKLSTNDIVFYPNACLWVVCGNNVNISGDFHRRAVLVRLKTDDEHPELRTNFKIKDVLGSILRARPMIVRSLLLVAKAYFDLPEDERPIGDISIGGSFDVWCRTIGGMLKYAGVEGFLGNKLKVYQKHRTNQDWADFLCTWHREHGNSQITMKILCLGLFGTTTKVLGNREFKGNEQSGNIEGFKQTLPDYVLGDMEKVTEDRQPNKLAEILDRIVDRNFGGYILRKQVYHGSNTSAKWWVESVRPGEGNVVPSSSGSLGAN